MSHVYPPYYMPPGYYQYPTHWPAYPEPPKPWECPRCRKIHAPHSMACDCKPSLGSVQGGTFHSIHHKPTSEGGRDE